MTPLSRKVPLVDDDAAALKATSRLLKARSCAVAESDGETGPG